MEDIFEDIVSCARKEQPVRDRDKCKAVGEGVEEKSGECVRTGAEQEIPTMEVDYYWDFFDPSRPRLSDTRSYSTGLWGCLSARRCQYRLALGFWRCWGQVEVEIKYVLAPGCCICIVSEREHLYCCRVNWWLVLS